MIGKFYTIANKKNFLEATFVFLKKFFVIYAFDKIFRLFNHCLFKKRNKRFLGHQSYTRDLCISLRRGNIFSFSKKMDIKFWDILSTRSIRTTFIKFDFLKKIAINSSCKILACMGNRTITIWKINICICIYSLEFLSDIYSSINFIKKSFIFFVINKENFLVIVDSTKGIILKKFLLENEIKIYHEPAFKIWKVNYKECFIYLNFLNFGKIPNIFQSDLKIQKKILSLEKSFSILSWNNYILSGIFLKIFLKNSEKTIDHETGYIV